MAAMEQYGIAASSLIVEASSSRVPQQQRKLPQLLYAHCYWQGDITKEMVLRRIRNLFNSSHAPCAFLYYAGPDRHQMDLSRGDTDTCSCPILKGTAESHTMSVGRG